MDVGCYFSTTLVGGELRGQGWAGRCGGERTVTRTKVAAPRESGGEMRGAESAASARLRAAWAFGGECRGGVQVSASPLALLLPASLGLESSGCLSSPPVWSQGPSTRHPSVRVCVLLGFPPDPTC